MEKTLEKPKLKGKKSSDECSSYDEDCEDVPNPMECWLGLGGCGVADGLCPLINLKN